jgi:hypothetical protein
VGKKLWDGPIVDIFFYKKRRFSKRFEIRLSRIGEGGLLKGVRNEEGGSYYAARNHGNRERK